MSILLMLPKGIMLRVSYYFTAATLRSPISLLWLFPSIIVATFCRKFFIHKLANTLAIATKGLCRNKIAVDAARPMQPF